MEGNGGERGICDREVRENECPLTVVMCEIIIFHISHWIHKSNGLSLDKEFQAFASIQYPLCLKTDP